MEFHLSPATSSVGAILSAAAVLAVMHAMLPSHWLSFVLMGRARKWSRSRTLLSVAIAGTGHVLLTALLGLLLASAGAAILHHLPPWAEQAGISVVLIALGVVFIVSNIRGSGHVDLHLRLPGASHDHHDHSEHDDLPVTEPSVKVNTAFSGADKAAMGALILGLVLSPCLDMLPLYVGCSAMGVWVLVAISLIFMVITPPLMILLVALSLSGLEQLKLAWLERYEGMLAGVLMVLLGVGLMLFVK